MDYKKIILPILMLVINVCKGQNCSISETTPFRIFSFENIGLIGKEYDNLKKGDSSAYHIFFTSIYGVNRAEAYWMSIDSSNHIRLRYFTKETVKDIEAISVNNIQLDVHNKIYSNDSLNGYYASECNTVVSPLCSRVLIICNHSQDKWLELTSIDGHMRSALKENPKYKYFLNVLDLLSEVFPDFNYKEEFGEGKTKKKSRKRS